MAQVGEGPDEDARITQALREQGYFSDQVPLSYEEQDKLQTACRKFGVPYPLALIERESGFRNVVGDDEESVGYMQVQEKWYRGSACFI